MRLSLLALAPVFPVALGCAETVSGPADGAGDSEPASTISAVVAVQRTADAPEGSRAEASARFIRVRGSSSSEDALRAIGAALDLPARGSCAALASLASLADVPAAQAPPIELLDVGEVSLLVDGVETRLSPRQLPDVTDVVSGVVYARAIDAALLPASGRYLLRVAGAHGMPAVDVVAVAPSDPADVQIAGEDAGTVVATGTTVDLTWTPSGGGPRADDAVYVDVRPGNVRCVLEAGGRGSVSTLLMDDRGTLVVHRLHREPLRAPGIDAGEIRFDFARTVAYLRRDE